MADSNPQSPDLRARELAAPFHLAKRGAERMVRGDRRHFNRSEQTLVRSITSRTHRGNGGNIRPDRDKTMTSNKHFQFLVRAPANGAPSRTLRSTTYGWGTSRSGSTPIGDRAQARSSRDFSGGGSVTPTGKSVTHVLNQKCYLCFDRTPQSEMKNAQYPMAVTALGANLGHLKTCRI